MAPAAAETVLDFALAVIGLNFRIQAAAKLAGGGEDAGGRFGVLRSLQSEGPRTVPDLARMRPVSRQRIQQLVDDMRAKGLVELQPNPRHKRSPLVAITPAGERHFQAARARFLAAAAALAPGIAEGELAAAAEVVKRVHAALAIAPGNSPAN